MIHAHITAWVLAVILFFVAIFLLKGGKAKGAKIIQMILRVLYVLILVTGLMMLTKHYQIDPLKYILKGVVGIWLIGLFEMILSRTANNRNTNVFWIQFVIALALVLYLGYSLPLSFMNP